MIRDNKEYAIVMCNWFNNRYGYIELEDVEELMWCIFGLEKDSFDITLINDKVVKALNRYVSCDMEEEFYNLLLDIYESIKHSQNKWEEEHTRVCSECKERFTSGYVIDNGLEYYCSNECLHKHYTEEEYEKLYDNGNSDTYWTEF